MISPCGAGTVKSFEVLLAATMCKNCNVRLGSRPLEDRADLQQ